MVQRIFLRVIEQSLKANRPSSENLDKAALRKVAFYPASGIDSDPLRREGCARRWTKSLWQARESPINTQWSGLRSRSTKIFKLKRHHAHGAMFREAYLPIA
jgi:hypothetical protein